MTQTRRSIDRTDALILLALAEDARLSGVELAQRLGISRNTVQSRLARLESEDLLAPIDRRVLHRALGYPLTAFVNATADQHRLADLEVSLRAIPEVVEVYAISGHDDLCIRIVAQDQEDLYRVAGTLLEVPGIQRTTIAFSIREMVPYRSLPLVARRAAAKSRPRPTPEGSEHAK